MKLRKFTFLIVCLMFAFFVAACADGSNAGTGSDNGAEQQKETLSSKIVLSADASTAEVGDVVSISVAFNDFEANPTSVDVYVKESSVAVKTGVAVLDGKISLDTSRFEAGTYSLYVKSGNISSNSIAVTLNENPLAAPKDVAVAASDKANTVKVTWTDNGAAMYWVYYNTSDDTENATLGTRTAFANQAKSGYEITLPSSGTYYFWVKAADGYTETSKTSPFGDAVKHDFTYTELSAPKDVAVAASDKTNTVKVTWTDNGAAMYWIYYNTSDDTENATLGTRMAFAYQAKSGYEITLPSSGTYYFWVKAADGYSATSNTSPFGDAVKYDFTYTELSAPKDVAVAASDKANTVKVTWTDNGAAMYWVYYNTSDDTENATLETRMAFAYQAKSGYEITLPSSGTYYFWVKAADGYSATSKTSGFSATATYTLSNKN